MVWCRVVWFLWCGEVYPKHNTLISHPYSRIHFSGHRRMVRSVLRFSFACGLRPHAKLNPRTPLTLNPRTPLTPAFQPANQPASQPGKSVLSVSSVMFAGLLLSCPLLCPLSCPLSRPLSRPQLPFVEIMYMCYRYIANNRTSCGRKTTTILGPYLIMRNLPPGLFSFCHVWHK